MLGFGGFGFRGLDSRISDSAGGLFGRKDRTRWPNLDAGG